MDNKMDEKTNNQKDGLSRRGFLEIGSAAAVTTAGMLLKGAATAQSSAMGVRTGRTTNLSDPPISCLTRQCRFECTPTH
jgi:hypothetical protein